MMLYQHRRMASGPELNPALFDPLTRIESACRRASNIMLTAVDPPRESKRLRNYWWYADAFGKGS
jgi:hypothetical protein